jgi:hypothetical protein
MNSQFDAKTIFDALSDPINLAIIIELLKNPNSTPNDIKKKINLPGSRIYHFINKLIEKNFIEETETEQLTSHLTRRKFDLSEWLLNGLKSMNREEIKKGGHIKSYHLFELHFAISIINGYIRKIEKIPEKKFDEYMNKLNLTHSNLFQMESDSIDFIKEKHNEVKSFIRKKEENYEDFADMLKKVSHTTLFGIFPLED